jgi:KDO2-lipid IV(A) lauroyltransferase
MTGPGAKNSFKKDLGQAAELAGVRLIRAVFRFMPLAVYRAVFPVLRGLARLVLKRKLKVIRANLRIVYKDGRGASPPEKIAGNCLDNFSAGLIELGYIADRTSRLKTSVTLSGRTWLDQALDRGRGAILLSAHFGNFIVMYLALVEHGYKVNVIMKPSHNPFMERYIETYRRRHGIRTVYSLPARQCVTESLRALKRNEVLVILLDQNFGGDGRVFVDFFGQNAATAGGPVVFAQRSGAPVLPGFMFTEARALRHRLEIRAPLELKGDPKDAGFVRDNVQMMTGIIEDQIRAVPHEWAGWMHKRWKSRTFEEQCVLDRLSEEDLRSRAFYS